MSTRAFRKLHGQDDILTVEDEDKVLEVPQPVKNKKKKKKGQADLPENPFDLLNNGEGDSSQLSDGVAEDTKPEQTDIQPDVKAKKKKKKKKKTVKDQTDNEVTSRNDEDEIDASIREVNALLGELPARRVTPAVHGGATSLSQPLFAVDHRNLNPDIEMRRIFGSRVVQTETRTRRRPHGKTQRKHYTLVQPTDQWRNISKTGLSMELLESTRGNQWFAFQHNQHYRQIQNEFWAAVDSLDPHNIMNILQLQPFHIDALLQLSEICKMSEDIQTAADLIERALYSFEHSFHPLFNISQGNCRLDYRRPENRAFYIALFRHMSFVGQRGCHRTALEFCKLILGLEPDGDPLCIVLMIDYYAIKSEQYEYLLRLHANFKNEKNLNQLPNFAYSTALAQFLQSQDENTDSADKMLQEALMSFPGVLLPLLDKCGVSPDAKVTSSPVFSGAIQSMQPDALKNLIALYVGRAHSCWKSPEVVRWLEENVNAVLCRLEALPDHAKSLKQTWMSRYRGMPRNIHRHIIMSEIREATAALPPELANTPVLSYDPLPPSDSIVSYERPTRRRVVDQDAGALSMFFRSLLPNFNPQEVLDEGELAAPAAGAAGGTGANLQQGVGALMDAMRDLLNNIQLAPPPVENQHEDDNQPDLPQDGEWD